MYYAPHILQKFVVPEIRNDEYGRPVDEELTGEWVSLCRCRCDHSDTREISMPDGNVFRPSFHIVCDARSLDVKGGDKIRCLWSDGMIKCEGHALKPPHTLNYLPYAEIYV
ncbi:MAG: hypothetical protein ACI4SO_05220 [Muribaculaceae bacterium]